MIYCQNIFIITSAFCRTIDNLCLYKFYKYWTFNLCKYTQVDRGRWAEFEKELKQGRTYTSLVKVMLKPYLFTLSLQNIFPLDFIGGYHGWKRIYLPLVWTPPPPSRMFLSYGLKWSKSFVCMCDIFFFLYNGYHFQTQFKTQFST